VTHKPESTVQSSARLKRLWLTLKARPSILAIAAAFLALSGAHASGGDAGGNDAAISNLQPYHDPSGEIASFSLDGAIDTRNAFFQSLGTNGRSCSTCHAASRAFSISPEDVRTQFTRSGGADPLFASIDGANCPDAVPGDAAGHSLLLKHGLIRVFLPVPLPPESSSSSAGAVSGSAMSPPKAEFTIMIVKDPYGCAMVTDPSTGQQLISVYRRPLPTTNLNFLSTVMFDGRETLAPLTSGWTFRTNLVANLKHQALDATNTHAQAAAPPTDDQLSSIVDFELGLFTAQVRDNSAGRLHAHGAHGGPLSLASQLYYPLINDSLGGDRTGKGFNPQVFTLFDPWLNHENDPGGRDRDDGRADAREKIAAGQQIFNTFPLTISNVRGLNDNPALSKAPNPPPTSFSGTCTTCHDTPNVGNHSFPLPLDIGTSHSPAYENDLNVAAGLSQLSVPDLPVYLISGCPNPFSPSQPESFYTTDPGKALITGKCSDFNRGKGPILRGLAARAPYFHNGAAANLSELVNFYNRRFQMELSREQKEELVDFLNSL
jgi:cytochrome c peroxidase